MTLLSGANISQVSPDKKRNAGWGRSEGCGTIRFDNTFTTRLSTNGMSTAFYLSAIKKGIILFYSIFFSVINFLLSQCEMQGTH